MCGPQFCSMNISHELRQYAQEQQAGEAAAPAVDGDAVDAAAGMAQMSEVFKASGAELYH